MDGPLNDLVSEEIAGNEILHQPVIFILCVEVLGVTIIDNENVVGIRTNDAQHKIWQFTDKTEMMPYAGRNSFAETNDVLI